MVQKSGLNCLNILVAWELWKHRNDCVFEAESPTVEVVLQKISNESSLWCMAGASALQELHCRLLGLGP